jgi:GTP-binding protein Era
MLEKEFRSGFVAIIGRPNAGKSTLLNSLLNKKLAIVSEKPQTTRNRITGVLTKNDCQIIFLDTPGIHKPKTKLGEYMVRVAKRSLKEVDLVLYLVDGSVPIGKGDAFINEMLKQTTTPLIICINKTDQLTDEQAKQVLGIWQEEAITPDLLLISALDGLNLEVLTDNIKKYLPPGPKYFPDDLMTDQPENLFVAEIIREKILLLTRDEVPHSAAVVVDSITERDNGLLDIFAYVYVERDSQKGIIIGKNGSMLKEIGKSARLELEAIFNTKVYLEIRIKLRKNWRKKEADLRKMGYEK